MLSAWKTRAELGKTYLALLSLECPGIQMCLRGAISVPEEHLGAAVM